MELFNYSHERACGAKEFQRVLWVQGGGAAHKNMEAPRKFETSGFLVSQT